jgi:hypothetical protein
VQTHAGTRTFWRPTGNNIPGGMAGPPENSRVAYRTVPDPSATAYVVDPGLVCRPGNVVQINGAPVEVQPEWWFPATSDTKAINRAVSLCQQCPAQTKCLILAMTIREEAGVWGGRMFERPTKGRRRLPQANPDTPLYDQQGRRVS